MEETNEWMNMQPNEWLNEWMKEFMSERANEWMNEVNERKSYKFFEIRVNFMKR